MAWHQTCVQVISTCLHQMVQIAESSREADTQASCAQHQAWSCEGKGADGKHDIPQRQPSYAAWSGREPEPGAHMLPPHSAGPWLPPEVPHYCSYTQCCQFNLHTEHASMTFHGRKSRQSLNFGCCTLQLHRWPYRAHLSRCCSLQVQTCTMYIRFNERQASLAKVAQHMQVQRQSGTVKSCIRCQQAL